MMSFHRESFGGSPTGIGAGTFVVFQPGNRDGVECLVRAPIAAAVEPVAVGASR